MKKKLIVIGGGAAGFFCAVNAARINSWLDVLLLEKANKLLAKVKISGGGRCNVTHACFNKEEMARHYPRGGNFVKRIFHQFFTEDTVQWFEDRGVLLKTEADGRMFPQSNTSQSIVDCLLAEAVRYGVAIKMQSAVKKIEKTIQGFLIYIENETTLNADFVCIAAGGFSKTSMFEWLKNLGHTILDTVPSLFTFNSPNHAITKLMGLSVGDAKVTIGGTKWQQRAPLLITHWGVSGPVVLRLSAWAARDLAAVHWNFTAIINWIPAIEDALIRKTIKQWRTEVASQKMANKNPFNLPSRLWQFLLLQSGINDDTRWADLPLKNQNKLIHQLTLFELPIMGKTTYKDEFVTAGGISLAEIQPHTMMSKKITNLFFAGEVLNVDGITGGYNFQNAWSTGYIAAKSIAHMASKISF